MTAAHATEVDGPAPPAVAGAGATDVLLGADGLSVHFGGSVVLHAVTFSGRRGEVIGLVGPNGSGKTTLLRALAGLVRPSSGWVRLDGRDLADFAPTARARRIAYMPQAVERRPFTTLEAVLMGRYPHLGRFELEGPRDREAALAAMRRAGVDEFAERQLDTLSGGERQRVLLARALAQEAGVLLLDEPTAALDLKHRLLTMDTVREEVAARGALAVAAMHDLSLASRYCDRLLLLSGGRVLSEGTPEEVLTVGNLRQAFGVETVIEPDSVTGRPQVVLLGAWNGPHTRDGERPRRTGDGVTVHIICGAGSGRDLMHQLVSAGYSVTACVLGEGDADRETAERLRLAFVPSPPFSAVTAEEHVRHLRLAAAADWVVLCDMVVGRNNLPNLLAAEQAKRLLLVHGRPSRELDYTGGEASQVLARLAQRGVRVLRADVLRTLARGQAAAT